ncbi:MAG: DUF1059 domain-containing protein [Saprospiraceae bacterium]
MKTLKCRDLGFDCEGVIKASTENEVLENATKHALLVHHVTVTSEMGEQIKTLIKEES